MKPKGVITAKKIAGLASMLPGAYGKVAGLVSMVLPNGQTVMTRTRTRRRRGLTYNDIKGATRVLRLVKKFAPAGSRMKLKSKFR